MSARQAMQRSAEQAGFFSHGRDRLVQPPTTMPSVSVTEAPAKDAVAPATPYLSAPVLAQHPLLVGLWQELPDPKVRALTAEEQENWD